MIDYSIYMQKNHLKPEAGETCVCEGTNQRGMERRPFRTTLGRSQRSLLSGYRQRCSQRCLQLYRRAGLERQQSVLG